MMRFPVRQPTRLPNRKPIVQPHGSQQIGHIITANWPATRADGVNVHIGEGDISLAWLPDSDGLGTYFGFGFINDVDITGLEYVLTVGSAPELAAKMILALNGVGVLATALGETGILIPADAPHTWVSGTGTFTEVGGG